MVDPASAQISIAGRKTEKLRVLHIITRMILGGAQENTLLSVEGLNRTGNYTVSLASGVDYGLEGELLSKARETCPLVVIPELYRKIHPPDDIKAFIKLYRIIRNGRFHIVHTHSSKAGLLGRLAAKAAGTPIIVHSIHGLAFHKYQPRPVYQLWRTFELLCSPITDHFISVSEIIGRTAMAAGIGDSGRFSTIYSGMELDWFLNFESDPISIRSEFGIPAGSLVVGKIARLFPLKGHDQLIDAAPSIVRRHPNVRFLLVGDGILQDHIRRRAAEAGILQNIVFAGLMDRRRIPEMISIMDVLVHTSLREGLARVLPQALAMGKPCVSFDLDGAPEVVKSGETGYLVRTGDAEGLADAISRLLSDEVLRIQMGKAGRRLVDPAFRAETMVQKIDGVYRSLVEKSKERISQFDRLCKKSLQAGEAQCHHPARPG